MNPDDLMAIIFVLVAGYFILVAFTTALRPLVFAFEGLFRALNYVQWFLHNPVRFLLKNSGNGKSRGFFVVLTLTGITFIWWFIAYFITLPFRVINGVYYDILLFSAVSFADNIDEFLHPKRGKLGHISGFKYFLNYVLTLPFRFIKMIIKSGLYVFDSILMLGVSIVFPTLTMLHGTAFRGSGTKIAQSGDWRVGHGNYAGTGVYFGLAQEVAEHYSPSGDDSSIIISRVTLTFCKTLSTLKKDERTVGLGDTGERLAQNVKGFYSSIEHWRDDMNWWEYCILKPKKMGEDISSWRIRPVALLNNNEIVRTYGGFAHYSLSGGVVAGLFSWFLILFVFASLSS